MEGFNTHRHGNNPLEKQIHDLFIKDYTGYNNVDRIVFGTTDGITPAGYIKDDREMQIVISTVQWMMSPVGQGLLDKMGFKKMSNEEKIIEWVKSQTETSIINLTNKLFPFFGDWEVDYFSTEHIVVVCKINNTEFIVSYFISSDGNFLCISRDFEPDWVSLDRLSTNMDVTILTDNF